MFRVVFASNYSDKSETGCGLLNNIREILMQIRLKKEMLTADIKAMFYQIRLVKEYWKFCGFLYWPKGVEKTRQNIKEFVLTRHTFGLKGLPFVACRSLQKIIENSNELTKEWKDLIWRSFYMDYLVIAMDGFTELEDMAMKPKHSLNHTLI